MDRIKKLRFEALTKIEGRMKELEDKIEEVRTSTNPFDIEARIYFMKTLSRLLLDVAEEMHRKIHYENSTL